MRNFEVILTYKVSVINQIKNGNIAINRKKIIDVELDESNCLTPEDFCNAIITLQERPDVVRINIREKYRGKEKPLNWIHENLGRIYLHNGIALILHKN